MTSKELTYQDIVKLRKQMQENNRNFYEQPIVITYQQAIQIENECLALEQENEKLKKAIEKHIGMLESLNSKVPRLKRIDICDCLEELIDRLKEVLGE